MTTAATPMADMSTALKTGGMVKGLESLQASQEVLVAGQQKLVEHLTQSMEPTMPWVVSSGDVSSASGRRPQQYPGDCYIG